MNTVLDAHYTNDTNPGSVTINAANILTKGGDLTIGGGANPLTTPAIGFTGDTNGIGSGVTLANGVTLNAQGGNISMRGQGGTGTTGSETTIGIAAGFTPASGGNTIQTSGNGNITLVGAGGNGATTGDGVSIWTVTNTSRNTVTAQNGNITIQGTGGTSASGNHGVIIAGAASTTATDASYTSGTGSVNINGIGAAGDVTTNFGQANVYLGGMARRWSPAVL